jgi:hypothetical protein
LWPLLALVMLTACSTTGPAPGAPAVTLAGSRELPGMEIKAYVPPESWEQLGGLEIERYVEFRIQLSDDGSVTVHSVRSAYPDHAWDDIARRFAQNASINASPNSDSKLIPRGELYVIFFKPYADQRPVLVYGYEVGRAPQSAGEVMRPQYFRLTSY